MRSRRLSSSANCKPMPSVYGFGKVAFWVRSSRENWSTHKDYKPVRAHDTSKTCLPLLLKLDSRKMKIAVMEQAMMPTRVESVR